MWHCDLLEKFPHHALARFVRFPDPNDRSKVEVKRLQFTLDTATHPTPGMHYDIVKDAKTGAESFTPWVPPQKPAAAPAETEAPPAETTAASGDTEASAGETNAGEPETVQ